MVATTLWGNNPTKLYIPIIYYIKQKGLFLGKMTEKSKKVAETLAGIKILPTFAPAIRKKHGAQQKGQMSDVMRNDDSNEVAEVLEKKVAEKFGSFKNTPYLCTRNLEKMMSRESATSCLKDSRRSS